MFCQARGTLGGEGKYSKQFEYNKIVKVIREMEYCKALEIY